MTHPDPFTSNTAMDKLMSEIETKIPPVPKVTDLDCAFPCNWQKLLPKWDVIPDDFRQMGGTPWNEAVAMLFCKGGRLSDHGITPKTGVDLTEVSRYIEATLGDFGPKHEHKIGGIAWMLSQWCEIKEKAKP